MITVEAKSFRIIRNSTIRVTRYSETMQSWAREDNVDLTLQTSNHAVMCTTINKVTVTEIWPLIRANEAGQIIDNLPRRISTEIISNQVILKFKFLIWRYILQNWSDHAIIKHHVTANEFTAKLFHLYEDLEKRKKIYGVNPIICHEYHDFDAPTFETKFRYELNPQAVAVDPNDPLSNILDPTAPLSPVTLLTPPPPPSTSISLNPDASSNNNDELAGFS
ncbi:unnamed protein product [Cunninghamella blakesleeana]